VIPAVVRIPKKKKKDKKKKLKREKRERGYWWQACFLGWGGGGGKKKEVRFDERVKRKKEGKEKTVKEEEEVYEGKEGENGAPESKKGQTGVCRTLSEGWMTATKTMETLGTYQGGKGKEGITKQMGKNEGCKGRGVNTDQDRTKRGLDFLYAINSRKTRVVDRQFHLWKESIRRPKAEKTGSRGTARADISRKEKEGREEGVLKRRKEVSTRQIRKHFG